MAVTVGSRAPRCPAGCRLAGRARRLRREQLAVYCKMAAPAEPVPPRHRHSYSAAGAAQHATRAGGGARSGRAGGRERRPTAGVDGCGAAMAFLASAQGSSNSRVLSRSIGGAQSSKAPTR